MFDKEISHYNVIISEYVPAIGKYRHYTTIKRYSEEDSVRLARNVTSGSNRFKVRIEQVRNIVGWWED